MIHHIWRATLTLAAGAVLTMAPAQAATAPTPHGVVSPMLSKPCAAEDSINCFWDAGSMGNGTGHSFYSVRIGHKMCTIYWERDYNRKNGYCTKL